MLHDNYDGTLNKSDRGFVYMRQTDDTFITSRAAWRTKYDNKTDESGF